MHFLCLESGAFGQVQVSHVNVPSTFRVCPNGLSRGATSVVMSGRFPADCYDRPVSLTLSHQLACSLHRRLGDRWASHLTNERDFPYPRAGEARTASKCQD
jgi:hypothetical protein